MSKLMIDFDPSLQITELRRAYLDGWVAPRETIKLIYRRIVQRGPADPAWIHLVPEDHAIMRAIELEHERGRIDQLPLYGIPFAVKDNIDVAGLPTTGACPAFAYTPGASAAAVQLLIDAGAICIGKTNLDQFATGLDGTRSPYGACASVFNSNYAAGGSSSGSAVVVAAGLASFALGTDTGGSGRIPAGFNNLVGIKPTRGLVSTRGLIPNCRTLDCVSVLALTVADGRIVLDTISGFDASDPFSRRSSDYANGGKEIGPLTTFTFGVPRPQDREFFGNKEAAVLYTHAIDRLHQLGGAPVEIDLGPFREVGALMFSGPWLAERLVALRDFIERHPEALLPVIRDVFSDSRKWSALDAFEHFYRLRELKRQIETTWRDVDVLAVPTSGTAYTIAEIQADPIRRNNHFGYYTYFVNLLDLCAVSVPNGFLPASGVAMGITLIGPPWRDLSVARIAAIYHDALGIPAGLPGTSVLPLVLTSSA